MRITRQDVLRVWSADQLVILESSPALRYLPEDARRIISEIGLPSSAEPLYEYEPLSMETHAASKYWRIGTDGGTSLLVGDSDSAVTSISPTGEYPIRHVNASLECFLIFLSRVMATRREFQDMADDDIDDAIDALYRDLLVVDASAFRDPDSWWSVVFEQMKDGLL
jgi:hypothetical protein